MTEPENIVLHLLREMREQIRGIDGKIERLATKDEMAELAADLRSEMHSLRADVASDLLVMEKRLNDQLSTLRRSAIDTQSTLVSHGILYGEIDQRLRRVEDRLEGAPSAAH